MKTSIGQDENVWTKEWNNLTPVSEIQMWDYFGLRQWITKFTPRFGKTIEAGCGLGRYAFYFSKMGIDIEGVDFSEPVVNDLNLWKTQNSLGTVFKTGNILNLDYEDNSLSGYISLGVVEHFIEGPEKALAEAYRALRPGGVAIISTPSVSAYVFFRNVKKGLKDIIKKILLYKKTEAVFFQYWYRPSKLGRFVKDAGFDVRVARGADLQFVFCEAGNFTDRKIKPGSFGYFFSNRFESSFLGTMGAQSITISVKSAPEMYCFLCGGFNADDSSLQKYSVPVCRNCSEKPVANYYLRNRTAKYGSQYLINPPVKTPEKENCGFCGNEYISDAIFEDYGFTKKVCGNCLVIPDINIKLSNEFIQPIWRKRNSGNLF